MCSLWSALHKGVVKFATKILAPPKKGNVDHHDDDLKHSFKKTVATSTVKYQECLL